MGENASLDPPGILHRKVTRDNSPPCRENGAAIPHGKVLHRHVAVREGLASERLTHAIAGCAKRRAFVDLASGRDDLTESQGHRDARQVDRSIHSPSLS